MIKFLSILIALLLLIVAYLLALPFFPSYSFIQITNATWIESQKSYFGAISSVFGIFFSFIGTCLGLYYFHKKNTIDGNSRVIAQHIKFIEMISTTLNDLGKSVYSVLHFSFESHEDLKKIRSKLLQDDDYLETLLTIADEHYRWKQKDREEILKFRSFISNNPLISHLDYSKITNLSAYAMESIETHKTLLNNAKLSCLRRIEDVYKLN